MTRAARSGPLRRIAGAIGWAALVAVLLSALPQGGVVPVAWLSLALVAFVLLALQLVLDLFDRDGAARAGALVGPAVLALAALGWGLVQVTPALGAAAAALAGRVAPLLGLVAPDSFAFPAWGSVAGPGTISADPIEGRQSAVRIALYLALFAVAARAGADPARAAAMVRAVALSVGALAAFGLYTVARGENVIVADVGTRLVSASFVNRNSFATVAAFGVVTSLAILLADARAVAAPGRRRALRDTLERLVAGGWVHLLGFFVSAAALLASQSRGGALAAACGVAAVLAAGRGDGRRRRAPILWVVLAAAAFALAIGVSGLLGRGGDIANEHRLPVYRAIVAAIGERPLLGYGLGAFQDAFRAVVPRAAATSGEWDLAHNTYLQMAFELGLPAAAAFYLALALVAARVWRAAFRRGDLVPVVGLGCTVVAAVHSTVDFSLQIPAIGALFATVLGIAWAQSAPPRGAQSASPQGVPTGAPPAVAAAAPALSADAGRTARPPRFARRR